MLCYNGNIVMFVRTSFDRLYGHWGVHCCLALYLLFYVHPSFVSIKSRKMLNQNNTTFFKKGPSIENPLTLQTKNFTMLSSIFNSQKGPFLKIHLWYFWGHTFLVSKHHVWILAPICSIGKSKLYFYTKSGTVCCQTDCSLLASLVSSHLFSVVPFL